MPAAEVLTFQDAIEMLLAFGRSRTGRSFVPEMMRTCIRDARDEIALAHDWSWLEQRARIILRAPQTDGTIEYDHTGGETCERQLTITDSTWPSWAADATVVIDGLTCDVASVESSTVLQLDESMNPGADVDAETEYSLRPRWYLLPSDFQSLMAVSRASSLANATPLSMEEIMRRESGLSATGEVTYYAVGPVHGNYGRMAIYTYPCVTTATSVDILYRKRLRDLRYSGNGALESVGTVTVSGTAVTGSSTTFQSSMVGSILRFSRTSATPTSMDGLNPWVEQGVIASVESTTALTLDTAVEEAHSAKGYVITDPVDIDVSARQVYLACCRRRLLESALDMDPRPEREQYAISLRQAKGGDCRVTEPIYAGSGGARSIRLADLVEGHP